MKTSQKRKRTDSNSDDERRCPDLVPDKNLEAERLKLEIEKLKFEKEKLKMQQEFEREKMQMQQDYYNKKIKLMEKNSFANERIALALERNALSFERKTVVLEHISSSVKMIADKFDVYFTKTAPIQID